MHCGSVVREGTFWGLVTRKTPPASTYVAGYLEFNDRIQHWLLHDSLCQHFVRDQFWCERPPENAPWNIPSRLNWVHFLPRNKHPRSHEIPHSFFSAFADFLSAVVVYLKESVCYTARSQLFYDVFCSCWLQCDRSFKLLQSLNSDINKASLLNEKGEWSASKLKAALDTEVRALLQ